MGAKLIKLSVIVCAVCLIIFCVLGFLDDMASGLGRTILLCAYFAVVGIIDVIVKDEASRGF